MPISSDAFKQVLGRFCTGVTIVTFRDESGIHGLTVNAFSSVSLEPPLVLICVDKKGSSHQILSETEAFVVNLLSKDQTELAYRFADANLSSEQRYTESAYWLTEKGIPVFEDNLGYLECKIYERFDGGDHSIFLGEVENGDVSESKRPLIFYSSQFYSL